MSLPIDFLKMTVDTWIHNIECIQATTTLKKRKVVNDVAERGIALITKYNAALTKNEEQKQHLLQVVAYHRKRFPDPKKALLT